jgi:hypothetical protein
MGVIDDFKSNINKDTIINASEKMLNHKYNINIEKEKLINIVNMIISSICADAILIKNVVKIIELNTIALTKVKDYIVNNIEKKNNIETENEDAKIEDVVKYNSEELLSKVLSLEEKRNATLSLSSIQYNTIQDDIPKLSNVENSKDNSNTFMIVEKMYDIMNNKNKVNKKTLIINSYNRDWATNHNRNKLSFSINIDLTKNYIEPYKLLLSKNIKRKNPYITMVINDGIQTQKINFILSNTTSLERGWDTWVMINENAQNLINLNVKNWNISFLDFRNKELDMGRDDIKICEIYDGKNENNFRIKIDNDDELLFDSYNIELLNKYDNMLLKTYDNEFSNVKISNIDNNYLTLDTTDLTKKDFIRSSLLNYNAQYCIILSYYAKNNNL